MASATNVGSKTVRIGGYDFNQCALTDLLVAGQEEVGKSCFLRFFDYHRGVPAPSDESCHAAFKSSNDLIQSYNGSCISRRLPIQYRVVHPTLALMDPKQNQDNAMEMADRITVLNCCAIAGEIIKQLSGGAINPTNEEIRQSLHPYFKPIPQDDTLEYVNRVLPSPSTWSEGLHEFLCIKLKGIETSMWRDQRVSSEFGEVVFNTFKKYGLERVDLLRLEYEEGVELYNAEYIILANDIETKLETVKRACEEILVRLKNPREVLRVSVNAAARFELEAHEGDDIMDLVMMQHEHLNNYDRNAPLAQRLSHLRDQSDQKIESNGDILVSDQPQQQSLPPPQPAPFLYLSRPLHAKMPPHAFAEDITIMCRNKDTSVKLMHYTIVPGYGNPLVEVVLQFADDAEPGTISIRSEVERNGILPVGSDYVNAHFSHALKPPVDHRVSIPHTPVSQQSRRQRKRSICLVTSPTDSVSPAPKRQAIEQRGLNGALQRIKKIVR